MKILILDGTFGTRCNALLEEVEQKFSNLNAEDNKIEVNNIEVVKIEDEKIAYCTGCWSCWVKTPGLCTHMDDTQNILRKAIQADMVVVFTENSVGYMTSHSKKVLEKFVPLIHPYIELVDGECHHVRRYDKYPKLGLIYIDDDLNKNDFDTSKNMVERAALNFKTTLEFAVHVTSSKEAFNNENINI